MELRGPLLVLLSGGRDSVCLLGRAVEELGAGQVVALHVDHGLRGADAARVDREHCAALCDRLGVRLVVEALADPPDTGNLHAWAREHRYALAERHRPADGWVATAHTATDDVETVLYRLATSPGRRALLGIAAERGRVVRPLLGMTREETAGWCRERGLPFRDDPANDDPRFARARVRHGLLASLRGVDPAAERNVLRTVAVLREEAAVLDELVAAALGGADAIAVADLAALPPALGRLVLRRMAEDATGALCPRAARRLAEVVALGEGGALDLGDGARARVARGRVSVVPTPPLPAAMRAP